YFFLSAMLYTFHIIVEVILAGLVYDKWHIEISSILYNRAKEISAKLGIASPDINFDNSIVAEIEAVHSAVVKWMDDLHQHAKDNSQNNWMGLSALPKN